MDLFKDEERRWVLQMFEGSDLKLHFHKAPGWFNRFMQRMLLGFIWTKL